MDATLAFGLEAIDPAKKDQSEVRNAASGRLAAIKGKFTSRMDDAGKDVSTDIADIHKRLGEMSEAEKKKLPVGKLIAVAAVVQGSFKYAQLMHIINDHAPETTTGTATPTPTGNKSALLSKLEKVKSVATTQLENAKKAGTTGASLAGLESELASVNAKIASFKAEGVKAAEVVAKAKVPLALRATMFVALVAGYALMWWIVVKIVCAGIKWIKKTIG